MRVNLGLRLVQRAGLCVAAVVLTAAIFSSHPTSAQNAPRIAQANVNGATLTYQDQGNGAPVVFVHGCCTDYRAWDLQRPAIAARYRFIALNLRYHGTAAWPDDGSKYSISTHADDVAAFVRGLNAGPVDLVGWSYSAPILLLMVSRNPDLVRSLALYEPAPGPFITDAANLKTASEDRQAMMGPVATAAKAGDIAAVPRLVPAAVNNQPDVFDTLPSNVRSMFVDNARTVPILLAAPPPPPITCDLLRQIKVPTLVMYGEKTRPAYHIATEAAAGCIPGAELVVLPGARHLALVQQPDAFNAVLLGFLAKVGTKPKP